MELPWTTAVVADLLRHPHRLANQQPWKGWIASHGGLPAVYAALRTMPLQPHLAQVLQAMLDHPGATRDSYAERLHIHRTTYYRHYKALLERIANALSLGLFPAPAMAPPTAPAALRRAKLPAPLAPLVGREAEMRQLVALLQQPSARLVTCAGPGGIGKTRLSLEAAAALAQRFRHGVIWIPLAGLGDPGLVASTIAQHLEIREAHHSDILDAVLQQLEGLHMLLVIDNFEHLISAAPVLIRLIQGAPQLTILVTSREVLQIAGEHVVQVPPLGLPPRCGGLAPETLLGYDAVRLFLARAEERAIPLGEPGLSLPLIAAICARLDGLPLAIELAVGRLPLLGLAAVLQRLDQALPLLTGGGHGRQDHQRTLRNTIDWSYELLTPAEQTLFGWLSVFAGGWTLESARSVCGAWPEPEVDAALGQLLLKSLVQASPGADGAQRFSMLAVIREYAQERLGEWPERSDIRQRHGQWAVLLIAQAAQHFQNDRQIAWFDRLELEHDNIRAALAWWRERDEWHTILHVAGLIWPFWYNHSHLTEGRDWLERALQATGGASPDRAQALQGAGVLARTQDEYPQAQRCFDEALRLFRAHRDQDGEIATTRHLAILALYEGRYDDARQRNGEGFALAQATGNRAACASLLINRALIAVYEGESADAVRLAGEGLALARQLGDVRMTALALWNGALGFAQQQAYDRAWEALNEAHGYIRALNDTKSLGALLTDLGYMGVWSGQDAQAGAHFIDALRLCQQVGNKENMAFCLEGFGYLAVRAGRGEYAAAVFGAADTLRRQIRNPLPPSMADLYEASQERLRQLLPEALLAECWAAGAARPLPQAIDYALAGAARPATADSGH